MSARRTPMPAVSTGTSCSPELRMRQLIGAASIPESPDQPHLLRTGRRLPILDPWLRLRRRKGAGRAIRTRREGEKHDEYVEPHLRGPPGALFEGEVAALPPGVAQLPAVGGAAPATTGKPNRPSPAPPPRRPRV